MKSHFKPFAASLTIVAAATMAISLSSHAHQHAGTGNYGGYGSGTGTGMGMGSGSKYGSGYGSGSKYGSGYSAKPGYSKNKGYGSKYERKYPQSTPSYGYQNQPMRPSWSQLPPIPPIPPIPPMRPYGAYGYGNMMPPASNYAPAAATKPQANPQAMPKAMPKATPATPAAPGATGAAPAEKSSGDMVINIQGMAYQPASLTVKTGTKVSWVNNDRAPHTVTSMDSGPLASGNLNFGNSFSKTFEEAGTFNYYCQIHPNMRAVINVE